LRRILAASDGCRAGPADDVFEGGITFSFNVVMVAAIWQT
jgi:hypothetical protein